MALALPHLRRPVATSGYRRILVPLLGGAESERAVDAGCRLAAERRSTVTAVSVIEVPPLLPLDARMEDEEADGRAELLRAEAIADAYGVGFHGRQLRTREAAAAVLDAVEESDAELIVVRANRKPRVGRSASPFARDIQQILRKAPCRVLVIAPPPAS